MTDAPTPKSPTTRTTLTLSPEALAALRGPISANGGGVFFDGNNCFIGYIATSQPSSINAELAAFIAALVNEALTPAEPVRMCADAECLNAADPTTPSGAFCLRHDVELRAECGVAEA